MDAIITKILIIVGLLLTTLSAALLPLFCLKLTTRFKRKSRHQKCPKCPKVCDCDEASIDVSTTKKTTRENGNLKSLNLGIQRSRSRKKMLMSVLNCFAGGIFLGTSFIGLLPEIRNGFKEAKITWPELTHRYVISFIINTSATYLDYRLTFVKLEKIFDFDSLLTDRNYPNNPSRMDHVSLCKKLKEKKVLI